ncbi:hypothetical protein NE237_002740 [Protea cynaroides]|uniref:NB-ARC domain-containing protein n=1 Tax=Protea cynaroides TaxID=273540 RepID=A0A9Q0KFQ7_9MAGN|nr:hypothetical protein NE237_002740 [Protea cynaroides]
MKYKEKWVHSILLGHFFPTSLQNRKTVGTFSFVDEVVGRDDDKLEVVIMLTSSDNQDILSVLLIVGMGGLGKIRFVKFVYKDSLVTKYFHERIWIHVPRDFDIKKVLTDTTKFITYITCQFSSIDMIQQNLKDELKEKLFLLVLNDIWNDDSEQCDMLNLLYTTLKVCGNCWSILKHKTFGNKGAEDTPNTVTIGKVIVKKYGGVPLAVKSLGGLLHIKKDQQECYDHLPSPLKQCFLYCSIFLERRYILKDDLIQQWIALGFIQPSIRGKWKMLEMINSFFQDSEKDDFGDIFKFKMHNLVFDLAHSLSRITIGCEVDLHTVVCGTVYFININGQQKNIRGKIITLIHPPSPLSVIQGPSELSSSIKKLKFLRYFNLGANPIETLPASITNLYNLQTLDLLNCPLKEFLLQMSLLQAFQTFKRDEILFFRKTLSYLGIVTYLTLCLSCVISSIYYNWTPFKSV